MSRSAPCGRTALPLPTGDASDLRAAAARIRRVAPQAALTDTVRGRVGPALDAVWSGPAAGAAVAEADVLAGRARALLGGIPVASAALERYAVALEHATRSTRTLQARWDHAEDDHRRALAAAHAAAPLASPEQVVLIERLRSEYRATLKALETRHEQGRTELHSAAMACADALERISTAGFPHARGTSLAEVRSHVIAGLTLAEEAVRGLATRERALVAAAGWRRLGRGTRSEDVGRWLMAHADDAGDPAFAQAFLEEVGVSGVMSTVTELGRAGGPVPRETVQRVVTTAGTLLISAVVPGAGAGGAGGRRRAVLSADVIRLNLLSQMSRVFASADGRTRHTGAWLAGQLLVGARRAGQVAPLPDTLLCELASAGAVAEIEESRDADPELRHGTTLRPNGSEQFVSYFPGAAATGDVLHQILREAGDDPVRQRAVLGAPVHHAALPNHRGHDLVVAEYLVRRWITHEITSHSSAEAVPLETDTDLVRLMRSASGDGSREAAAIRARVMAEISRTNGYARQEFSTIRSYELHTAAIEREAVGWLLAMPASVSETLRAPDPSGAYSTAVEEGYQPRLRLDELTGLVGAFAVAGDLELGGKPPAANHRALIDGELDALRRCAARGMACKDDVTRMGFHDAVASAALIAVARGQDAVNRSMWTNLAEVKNVVLTGRMGPLALFDSLQALATGGTTRTALDDLVISALSSDLASRQAEANDARSELLMASIRTALSRQALGWSPSLLAAAGRALAPPTPGGAQARAERQVMLLEELNAYLDERGLSRLWEAAGPHSPGSVDRREIAVGRDGPLHEFQALPAGRTKKVRLVESETELLDLHAQLTRDARLIPSRAGGDRYWMERPDGIQVGLRLESLSGGATIDLKFPDGSERKVHIRGYEPTSP